MRAPCARYRRTLSGQSRQGRPSCREGVTELQHSCQIVHYNHSLGRNAPGRLLLDAASAPLGRRLLGLVAALGLRGQALLAPSSKEGESRRLLCLLFILL